MNRQVLWNRIESRLESSPLDWRERIRQLGQIEAVEQRDAGRTWSDDEVFEALLMAVLSSDTDWSNIERIQAELPDLFSGFSLASYAKLSDDEIDDRFVPWFQERKAGSRSRKGNLLNLVGAARKLLDFSRKHGTADDYFTSLVDKCDGDPKQAALRLGQDREYKLPSLGVFALVDQRASRGLMRSSLESTDSSIWRSLPPRCVKRRRSGPKLADRAGRRQPIRRWTATSSWPRGPQPRIGRASSRRRT